MLNLIRNNFPEGFLVRFLTDLALKNYEMTATESARNLLRSKERITLSKIKQSP
jgi:hypothetical protein